MVDVQEEYQQQDENLKDQTQTRSQGNEPRTHKEKPKFAPPLDFNSSSYNFKEELNRLPFPVSMGDMEMSFELIGCFFYGSKLCLYGEWGL